MEQLRYRVVNTRTQANTFYDTAEEVIAGIPVVDDEEKDFIFTLFDKDSETEVHNPAGDTMSVKIVPATPPPGGEGGRRKSSRKKQMRTQKRKGGRRMHVKTVKRVGRYIEAPRARSVFQTEGGRRKTHRRL
jgi:hypothetical protein